jgi:hypothetical protein
LKKPKRIMMLVKGKFVFNYNVISTGGTWYMLFINRG